MLQPEQLYPHLPRKIISWTPQDVRLWFGLHSISINPSFSFQQHRFDGSSFLKVTPQFLHEECGIGSVIVIKKILEWIQQDLEQFQEYIDTQNEKNIEEKYHENDLYDSFDAQPPHLELNKQNTPRNNSETPNEIDKPKHFDSIQSLQNVQKWNKRKSLSSRQKPIIHHHSSEEAKVIAVEVGASFGEQVKFAESNYQICDKTVQFRYNFDDEQIVGQLNNNGRIGRNQKSDLIIKGPSVSRQHAQLLRINNQFYIRDIGSKFGTFREIGQVNNKPLEEGDILSLGQVEMEIIFLKINMKTRTFDMKLRLLSYKKGQILSFYSQKTISIGRKNKCISLDDSSIGLNHCVLMMHPDNNVHLIKEQGQCYLKLKKGQLYQLQEDQCILLGSDKVKVTVIKKNIPIEKDNFIKQE